MVLVSMHVQISWKKGLSKKESRTQNFKRALTGHGPNPTRGWKLRTKVAKLADNVVISWGELGDCRG